MLVEEIVWFNHLIEVNGILNGYWMQMKPEDYQNIKYSFID